MGTQTVLITFKGELKAVEVPYKDSEAYEVLVERATQYLEMKEIEEKNKLFNAIGKMSQEELNELVKGIMRKNYESHL